MNIKAAIENYLTVISSTTGDEDHRIKNLIASLDELALLANKIEYTSMIKDYPEPPEKNYSVFREQVTKVFPSLGYYNVALDISEHILQSSLSVGDAIDDIVDIAGDLAEILWRFNNTSEDDALFHLDFTFRTHWGMHLRSLQLYLYFIANT
jgi:Domain of unknown function (DUF5063)